MTRWRRWTGRRRKIVVFIVTMLALEGLLRLLAGNMQVAPYAFHLDDGRCIGLQPDREVTYTGWLWRIDPVTHDTNTYGYRGDARPPDKPPGTFRIAALGDSFVYGQGVNNEDTVSSQLERALRVTRPGVEVLNFGVPGYGIDEYLLQYERFITRWSPDLLLLFFHDSDLDDAMCRQIPDEARSDNDGQLPSYVLRAAFMVVKIGGNLISRVKGKARRSSNVPWFSDTMKSLQRSAEARGTRLAVVTIGSPLRDKTAYSDTLWLHRIPTLLEGDAVWQLERIPGETHFTPKGLGELAGHVEGFLEREDLLPAIAR